MQKFIIFLLVVLFSANLAEAKSTEDVPFFKTYQVDLQLDLYKGEPFMITSTSFELVYPTEKSTRYLPSYSFYLSDDDELEELNLYYRDKRGKKKQVTYFDLKVSENNSREYFVTGTKKYTINFFKLEAGVNVILEYTVTTDELHYFSPFYFNRLLDTRNLKYSMQIPKDMQVKLVKKYLDKVEMEKETLDKGKYRYITYEAKNRDEIEFYNDGPDFSFYTPHILPILEKYKK